MSPRPRAQIRSANRRYPFALKVTVTETGLVRWDRVDTTLEGRPFMVCNTSIKSARTLAQWILDNTAE